MTTGIIDKTSRPRRVAMDLRTDAPPKGERVLDPVVLATRAVTRLVPVQDRDVVLDMLGLVAS